MKLSFNCNRIYETARRTLELYVIDRKRLESPINDSLFETKAIGAGCLYQEGEKTYIFSVEHLNPGIDTSILVLSSIENGRSKMKILNFNHMSLCYKNSLGLFFCKHINIIDICL